MIDLKQKLNKQQLLAVTHEGKPLLVLAGAGSGKTRVLTYRAYWLIKEREIDPGKIVLLTFTNKAAKEMSGRVEKLLREKGSEFKKSHLGGARVGTQSPSEEKFYLTPGVDGKLGFAGTFHGFCVRLLRIYGETIGIRPGFVIYDTSDQRQTMKRALTNLGQENTPKKVRMYLAIASKYKNSLVGMREAEEMASEGYQKTTIKVWREYQRLLNSFNALDFDDLLTRCVKLLRVKEIREKVHKRFDWILVDEYQDTNNAQFELTRLLVNNPHKLTVVGDASQAIYSFRGADFRNLELLKKCFEGLKIVELVENYRSTQNILDVAHKVIGNNTGHPVLELKTKENGGDKVVVFEGIDGRSEAKFVVENCLKASKNNKSVAVLYRTNAQSRILEEELIRAGISYRLVGGVRFYERKEIKDLLAYLRVVVNKVDAISWDRIEKLGKRKMAKFEAWLESKDTKDLSTDDLIREILEVTEYLERFDKKSEEDLGRLENIDELLAVASEFSKVDVFLENVALIQAEDLADQLQPKETQVTLMTIHSAKGLEFDVVFVVGLEEGLLPHSRSLLEKDSLEEERRLMYVAITRARQKLYFSLVGSRYLYGNRQAQVPSRFLGEIPEYLTQKIQGFKLERTHTETRSSKWQKSNSLIETPSKEKLPKRRIVQDWEIEKESRDDFGEIDSW